jgi:hypothetical protein
MSFSGLRVLRSGDGYSLDALRPQEATYVMQNPRNIRLLRDIFDGITAIQLQLKFCNADVHGSSRKHPWTGACVESLLLFVGNNHALLLSKMDWSRNVMEQNALTRAIRSHYVDSRRVRAKPCITCKHWNVFDPEVRSNQPEPGSHKQLTGVVLASDNLWSKTKTKQMLDRRNHKAGNCFLCFKEVPIAKNLSQKNSKTPATETRSNRGPPTSSASTAVAGNTPGTPASEEDPGSRNSTTPPAAMPESPLRNAASPSPAPTVVIAKSPRATQATTQASALDPSVLRHSLLELRVGGQMIMDLDEHLKAGTIVPRDLLLYASKVVKKASKVRFGVGVCDAKVVANFKDIRTTADGLSQCGHQEARRLNQGVSEEVCKDTLAKLRDLKENSPVRDVVRSTPYSTSTFLCSFCFFLILIVVFRALTELHLWSCMG